MKYIPNLIPDAYRVELNEFQQNNKKNNRFQKGIALTIVLICLAVLAIFVSKSKQNAAVQEVVHIPSPDSLKQLSRRDSLNLHQKAAELAIQKSKWRTASVQYCKALEFSSPLDSQYLLNQILICKKKIRSLPKRTKPAIDSTNNRRLGND
jgi:dephospho-CoA kinase